MFEKHRVRVLEQADHDLNKARRAVLSADRDAFSKHWPVWMNAMEKVAFRYRACGLGLLARRVVSVGAKCCRARGMSPEAFKPAVLKAWAQFDELNARDHFRYSVQRFEGAE